MAPLTSISDRLTPSVPLELTFGAQPVGTGRKVTTLFAHMASAPGIGMPYQVYNVVNVGDPVAAKTEVDTLAGVGSQAGKMAFAFVNANAAKGGSNFPAFRVILIPFGISNFGPNQEATNAAKTLRNDMFVSCYPASDSTNRTALITLTAFISGPDRDLTGQFGSFMTVGSLDSLTTAVAYAINSRFCLVAFMPDSNTDALNVTATATSGSPVLTAVIAATLTKTGTLTNGSNVVTAVSNSTGVYPGATITGTGLPANTVINQIIGNTFVLNNAATSDEAPEALTIVNVPATAGIYPGALLTGTGIPAATTVLSVTPTTITMSANATATGAGEAVAVQNQVSQASEIVAAAHAGALMASAFPYNPVQGVTVGGLVPPQKSSDLIQIDPNGSSEAALVGGLSPLYQQPGGTMGFIRSRTTLTLKPDNVTPVTAYFDWQDLVVMNDFREVVYGLTQNPPFNNNPGGTKASIETAAKLKDEVLAEAQVFEDLGAFQAVKSLASSFQIAPSATSRGRFDFKIPINVLPGLYVIAGNIQGVTTFDFTL